MKFFCEYWKSGKEKEHYGVCKCGNQVFLLRLAYDTIIMLSDRDPTTGGGDVYMEIIISFLVSCTAGVVCHYIIKWLDGDE
ncbi:hypothetical protein [Ruminococcus sp. RTP21484sp1]|uniref:hypothetical protein n=1 Tax=Ruminococcus sp. RTP21484sp1 TaxID=3151395 RepID=UPI003219446E